MSKILLAGATGYLGGYILSELLRQQHEVRVIVRNRTKLEQKNYEKVEVIEAEITKLESINNCCDNIDFVISTVGITKQKDGLTYMDVDYQANKNLLKEAKKSGVKKFVYISLLNGQKLKNLKICEAKELFVNELKKSGIDYCIIRPNGFFSDMSEIFYMAQKGRVYLFGDGKYKANPIHGEDLAVVCVNSIENARKEINIGGPETLSQNEIASIAFNIAEKEIKITYIPNWIRKIILFIIRTFTSQKFYGSIEFFLTVLSMDMIAPEKGKHTLEEFYGNLKNNHM
ncbi:NAD(P)H-binding protein [Iocasia frigidifontis]|uniref:NAD(P)H-binding protein n=1 Tax=Iocasia fonsfrigidae TaxID=2682810 RepID=A0A8A7KG50_9FIRM|nr:SDR family oxidoreductase [Iocasia fonsfrigidae]QTL97867.1 NAD(P)H-binding protein [Iocasia fonsfrigidae]